MKFSNDKVRKYILDLYYKNRNQILQEYRIEYAKLCEQKGDLREALNHFSLASDSDYLIHAVELALKLKDSTLAEKLIKKVKSKIEEDFSESRSRRGYPMSMGAALSVGAMEKKFDSRIEKISKLEKDLKK